MQSTEESGVLLIDSEDVCSRIDQVIDCKTLQAFVNCVQNLQGALLVSCGLSVAYLEMNTGKEYNECKSTKWLTVPHTPLLSSIKTDCVTYSIVRPSSSNLITIAE